MTTDALKHPVAASGFAAPHRPLAFVTEHFLWLPIGGLIALVWANLAPEGYFSFAHRLAFAVNDIAMSIFFLLIAQEVIEAVMPGGALHTWRRWSVPLFAAVGVVGGSAGVYLAYVTWHHELVLRDGWPVATAIDLAFVYMLVRSLFHRHPAAPFVLLAAIGTNVVGLLVIASRQPFVDVRPGGAALMLAAIVAAFLMRTWKVRNPWAYLLVSGPLSWWALYLDGFHPALALVPVALFLPHTPRSTLFDDAPSDRHGRARHLEHALRYPVHVVLFMFGLVNAGVVLSGYGTGTWALLAASFIGKPIGLLLGTAVALALGLHLPRGLHWRDLGVVALATCGGFAFALFFATAVYPLGPVLGELKFGTILSGVGVLIAIVAARFLRVGRFKPAAAGH